MGCFALIAYGEMRVKRRVYSLVNMIYLSTGFGFYKTVSLQRFRSNNEETALCPNFSYSYQFMLRPLGHIFLFNL